MKYFQTYWYSQASIVSFWLLISNINKRRERPAVKLVTTAKEPAIVTSMGCDFVVVVVILEHNFIIDKIAANSRNK